MAGVLNSAVKTVGAAAAAATLLSEAGLPKAWGADYITAPTPTNAAVPASMVLNYTNSIPMDGQLLSHATDLLKDGRIGGVNVLTGGYYELSSGGGGGVSFTLPMLVVKTPANVDVAALGVKMMLLLNINGVGNPIPNIVGRYYQATIGATNEQIAFIPDDYARTGVLRADYDSNITYTQVRNGSGDGFYVYSMTMYFPRPAPLPKNTIVRIIPGPYEDQMQSDHGGQAACEVKGASADRPANLMIGSDGTTWQTYEEGHYDEGKLGIDVLVVPWIPERPTLALSNTPSGAKVLTSSPIQATSFNVQKSSDMQNWVNTGVEFSPTNTTYNFGQLAQDKLFFRLEMKPVY